MTDDLMGQTLGQYRIEAPPGPGGMGQVYRGVHRLLNRPAAPAASLAQAILTIPHRVLSGTTDIAVMPHCTSLSSIYPHQLPVSFLITSIRLEDCRDLQEILSSLDDLTLLISVVL